jgi:type II secretory pathway component PulL
MRVRALQAQRDARSRPRWRRWLLIAGDVALALTLAALTFLATASHYDEQNRPVGIALILRHRTEIAR